MSTHDHTYTVQQLAELAGVSARTLRHYDQIGLLRPARRQANGYRAYGQKAVLRLQQILFFRELGLGLETIGEILDKPGFDALAALHTHRANLQGEAQRLQRLLRTVDKTIAYLEGEEDMQENEMFDGFSEEKQKEYEAEIRQRYGADNPAYVESTRRWNSYTPAQRQEMMAGAKEYYRQLKAARPEGPASPTVQKLVESFHQSINQNFYACSLEMLRGLGQMYVDDPRFTETFEKQLGPGGAEFMRQAINYYCDNQ